MQFRILCVGKPRGSEISRLCDDYSGRIARMGVGYDLQWVRETPSGSRYSAEEAKRRESDALLARHDGIGTLIALDPGGRQWSSEQLSGNIERWASRRATFVIGGPSGLHGSFLDRADHRWSLSTLTFPHDLVRLVLVEQLYRALSISRGSPYHK